MTSQIETVHVALSERSYDISIGAGILVDIDKYVSEFDDVSHVVVISDSNVSELYAGTIFRLLSNEVSRANVREAYFLVVDAGEESKSVDWLSTLWQSLLEVGADRKTLIVAVGGGVIGDLAGFAAASYGRGIRFVQVPTTLLAQVDSSVGGKTGINLPKAKNMVGAFWQPLGVLIDTQTLRTLPAPEFSAGLAEVIKYGVILDDEFFAMLENNIEGIMQRESDIMQQVIKRCCELKAYVVQEDERETTGLRAVLNYGHTFCHAIESVTGYGHYLHGEAVSIGMLCASRLAAAMGRIDSEVTDRQQRLLEKAGLPVAMPDLDHDALIAIMRNDKKAEHGKMRFVLPTRLGHVELVGDVDEQDVRNAMQPSA